MLGCTYPALLDTGSSISIIGTVIMERLAEFNIEMVQCKKNIVSLSGLIEAASCVELEVEFPSFKRLHTFIVLPTVIKYILLGRDFIGSESIGIFIGQGGYTVGVCTEALLPFSKNLNEMSLLHTNIDRHEISNEVDICEQRLEHFIKELELECSEDDLPASVLFSWLDDLDELQEKEIELEENLEKLFPDNEYFLIPEELVESEKEALRKLMAKHMHMFTSKPGLCTLFEHQIDTGDALPIKAKTFPMSPGKRKAFDETFEELLELDIIEPSNSPWSSNAFVIGKPDGSYRFLVNYKPLNAVTKVDSYPVPSIENMLSHLGRAKKFSSVDASKGFYQISIAKKDREKTAFRSHRGHFQFKRLSMGLVNGPPTFQRTSDVILGDILYVYALCFFDDNLIYSGSFTDHLEHLDEVFSRFDEAGFTFHPKKIQLCRRRLRYLGFIIEPGKVSPDPEKVLKIRQFPPPKDITELRRFLGCLSYYRRFIEKFAVLASPLYKLTSTKSEYLWTSECQTGFESLKAALCDFTQVYLPDLDREFIITCDASRIAVAAILSQEKDGVRYPIFFSSRALKPAEKNYSVSEIELLAILFGINKYRQYIELTHFVIETDHRAISFLSNLKDPTGRLARWFMVLQSHNFTVKYKPGNSSVMKTADALSRVEQAFFMDEINDTLSRKAFIESQDSDEFLSKIKRHLKGDYSLGHTDGRKIGAIARTALLVEDGLLLKYVGPKGKIWENEGLYYRVWVPMSLRENVISEFHDKDLAAHLGRRKTYAKLEQRVYWNGMHKDVEAYVRKCVKCVQSKTPHIIPVPGRPVESTGPWEVLSVDLMGPYTKGTKQSRVILVMVDIFTKWVEIFPLREGNTRKIVERFKEVFLRMGFPKTIISDNGTQFSSKLYADWTQSMGIQAYYISPYHAQANPTERYNQTIKSMIRALMNKSNDWDKSLQEIAFSLRTATNRATEFTPAYLVFGRELRYPFDNKINQDISKLSETKDIQERLLMVHNIAKDNMLQSQYQSLAYKNKNAKERTFEVGQVVWYRTHILSDASKGVTAGLMPKLEGPFEITTKVTDHVFHLKHTETGGVVNRVHINDIAPYQGE